MRTKKIMVSEIIDDIRRVFEVLTERSKKVEYETDLTGPQLWAIKLLAETSPVKVSDLARRMYLHPATMVGLLDRLETKGLVQRTRSDRDRRVVHIHRTDNGRALVEKSPEAVQGLLVNGLELLDSQELNKTSEGLGKIVEILGAKDIPPKLIMSSEINSPKRKGKKAVPPLVS